jgi:predicted amidophosphoribosyltransferase
MWIPRLLGGTCVGCQRSAPSPCSDCRRALQPVGLVDPVPEDLDLCLGAFVYDGVGRTLVTTLKYENRRDAVAWLCKVLAVQLRSVVGSVDVPPVVTWVPASPGNRRRRGFDQGAVLATGAARRLNRPARRLLDRAAGPAQTGAGRQQRLEGPVLRARHAVDGPVLVIDDVTTTGASLTSAARTLRAAGATAVVGATLAVTPQPGGRPVVDPPGG